MGALTAKPTAFNFRTWDVNSIMYTSCQDSLVPLIRVDIYQKKVVRVLPLEDWINDSMRFLFMNLDKQTFKLPGLIFKLNSVKIFQKLKKILRNHTYTSVIYFLIKRINKKRFNKINLNFNFGALFTKNLNIYQRLNIKSTNINVVSKNSFLEKNKKPDVSLYNEILMLDINPRLDSPLLNLSLKELDSDFFSVKAFGNYNSSFEVVSNNVSGLMNQSKNSLIIFSETYKNNEFLNSFPNSKYNLSPVYLNMPLVFNEHPLYLDKESMNFDICNCEILNKKPRFNVNLSTRIFELDFDVFLPTNNYFVTSGDILSIKGESKLKQIRPGFDLKDHFLAISLILQKSESRIYKNSNKIFNFRTKQNFFSLNNKLNTSFKKLMPLQK